VKSGTGIEFVASAQKRIRDSHHIHERLMAHLTPHQASALIFFLRRTCLIQGFLLEDIA